MNESVNSPSPDEAPKQKVSPFAKLYESLKNGTPFVPEISEEELAQKEIDELRERRMSGLQRKPAHPPTSQAPKTHAARVAEAMEAKEDEEFERHQRRTGTNG